MLLQSYYKTLLLCTILVICLVQVRGAENVMEGAIGSDCGVTKAEETLLHITEICRHGARAPMKRAAPLSWMEGLEPEELTPVGFRQQYISGKDMLLKYPEIFDKRLNMKQIYARSTGYNRTIQSASAHLYGIFEGFPAKALPFENGNPHLLPATEQRTFDDKTITFDSAMGIAYNPFPVHTPSHTYQDEFLKAEHEFCNKTWPDRMVQYNRVSALVNDSLQGLLSEAYTKLNMKIPEVEELGFNLWTGFFIADFIIVDQANSKTPLLDATVPENKILIDTLKKSYAMNVQSFYLSPPQLKVAVTGFMSKIRDDFKAISEKFKTTGAVRDDTTLRYQLFSGHDSTIVAVLMASGNLDPECLQKEF